MATATEEIDDVEAEAQEQSADDQEIETTEQEPAPAQIPPPPPEDAAAHIREHYDAICEKERNVHALENEYLELKEEAAGAKKAFEAADKQLRNLIARGPDRQRKLPLDDKPAEPRKPKRIKLLSEVNPMLKAGFEPPFTVDADGDVSAVWNDGKEDISVLLTPEEYEVIEWENGDESQPAEVVNDAWRKAPFSELGLTLKQNELFEAVGVTTIGGLEDLRAAIAENKPDAQWPKGIGPAKVTDIENRVIDWLDKNRDKFGEPTEKPTELFGQSIVPEGEADHKANGNGKAR